MLGVIAIAKNTFSLIRNAETFVIGKSMSRAEAPNLWARTESLAKKMGALCPQNIVLGLDPNFFVTEADVVCLAGKCSGRTLYCSLPLMRILSESEFDAVIGHELGHYKGLDTKFSLQFYPIYRGTTNSIKALSETGGEGSGAVALLPAIAIFGFFLESFSIAENQISRERELMADKHGASVSDTATMSISLLKIHAFSGLWSALQNAIVEILKAGKIYTNASKTYAEVSIDQAKPEIFNGVIDNQLNHPTDSHPPLGMRLESLGFSVRDISERALDVSPKQSSINFIQEPEIIEEEISLSYQVIIAKNLGIDLESVSESQKQTS